MYGNVYWDTELHEAFIYNPHTGERRPLSEWQPQTSQSKQTGRLKPRPELEAGDMKLLLE